MAWIGEPYSSNAGSGALGEPTSWWDLTKATYESMHEVDNSNASRIAMERAADEIIDGAVRAGIKDHGLDNPAYVRPRPEPDFTRGAAFREQEDDPVTTFDRRRTELAAKYPEQSALFKSDRSLTELARERARIAEEHTQNTAQRYSGLAPALTASLSGGVAGSFYDPINVLALAAGPWGRVAQGARAVLAQGVKTGLVNVGAQALVEPFSQMWRQEAGLEYGLSPAALNLASAFGLGFGLDAGIRGTARAIAPRLGLEQVLDERGKVSGYRARQPAQAPAAGETPRARLPGEPAEAPAPQPAPETPGARLPEVEPRPQPQPEPQRAPVQAPEPAPAPTPRVPVEAVEADRPDIRGARQTAETQSRIAEEPSPFLDEADRAERLLQAMRNATDEAEPPPRSPDPVMPVRESHGNLGDDSPAPPSSYSIDGKPVTFRPVPARSVATDAGQFQFKGGTNEEGVALKEGLLGVTRWDPIAAGRVFIFQRADGTFVIADGHQRLALAKRLEATGHPPIELNASVFREADGWTAADVRALGAKKNLQEGRADVIDAATILRERPDVLDGSVPLTGYAMRQARALARLSDEAWGKVVRGEVAGNHAAIVGELVEARALHGGVLDALAKAEPRNAREVRNIINDLLHGPRDEVQEILLGGDPGRGLLAERASVLDRAIKLLKEDAGIFALLSREASRIMELGNVLRLDANADRVLQSETVQAIIETLASRPGPVRDWLTEAARDAAQAGGGRKAVNAAAKAFAERVRTALETEGIAGLKPHEAPPLNGGRGVDEPGGADARAQVAELEAELQTAMAKRMREVAERSIDRWFDDRRLNRMPAELLNPVVRAEAVRLIAETGESVSDAIRLAKENVAQANTERVRTRAEAAQKRAEEVEKDAQANLPAYHADLEAFYAREGLQWDLSDQDVQALARLMAEGRTAEQALADFRPETDLAAVPKVVPAEPLSPEAVDRLVIGWQFVQLSKRLLGDDTAATLSPEVAALEAELVRYRIAEAQTADEARAILEGRGAGEAGEGAGEAKAAGAASDPDGPELEGGDDPLRVPLGTEAALEALRRDLRKRLGLPDDESKFALGADPDLGVREAAARAVMETEAWRHAAEPPTDKSRITVEQDGYGTIDWRKARRYVDEQGQEIKGWDAAVAHLVKTASDAVEAGVEKGKRAVILIGYPGAGKSTIARPLSQALRAAHITADDAKRIIPEYEGGANTWGVHQESAHLALEASFALVNDGRNLIVETLGTQQIHVEGRAQFLKDAGYNVTLIHVDVPKAVAMERAVERFHAERRAASASIYDTLDAGGAYAKAKESENIGATATIAWDEAAQGWHLTEASDDALRGTLATAADAADLAAARAGLGGAGGIRGLEGGVRESGAVARPGTLSSPDKQVTLGDREARDDMRETVLTGDIYKVAPEVGEATRRAVTPLADLAPEGYRLAVLERIDPVLGGPDPWVTLYFRAVTGDEIWDYTTKLSKFDAAGAMHIPRGLAGGRGLVFLRYGGPLLQLAPLRPGLRGEARFVDPAGAGVGGAVSEKVAKAVATQPPVEPTRPLIPDPTRGARPIGALVAEVVPPRLGSLDVSFDRAVRGDFLHELVHALRFTGVLDGAVWDRLVAHVEHLRIMERSAYEFELRTSHSPLDLKAEDFANNLHTHSLAQLYHVDDASLKGLSGDSLAKALRTKQEEGVTHMLQLVYHGGLSEADAAPIRDILQTIFKGRWDQIAQGLIEANDNALNPRRQPMFALGGAADSVGASQRRALDHLGFYSQALEAAKAWPQKKGTPEQARRHLTSSRVKENELQTLNLDAFLEGKKSVTKSDLVSFLEQNRVEVREAVYRSPVFTKDELAAHVAVGQLPGGDLDNFPQAKWSHVSLDPSNPTYRESVLYLPPGAYSAVPHPTEAGKWALVDRDGNYHLQARDEVGVFHNREVAEQAAHQYRNQLGVDFRDSHFSGEPNPIVNVGTSIQKDAQGNAVGLLDRFQPQWAQNIRDRTREAVTARLFGKGNRFKELSKAEKAQVSKEISEARKRGDLPAGVRDEAKIADLKQRHEAADVEIYKLRDEINSRLFRWNRELGEQWLAPPVSRVSVQDGIDQLADLIRNTPRAGKAIPVEMDARYQELGTQRALLDAELKTAQAATPGHPLVNTTDQALETGLKRLLRQFIDADVDRIAISPAQVLIDRGEGANNPAGMKAFYEEILPRALLKLLRTYDPEIKGPSSEGLFSSMDGREFIRNENFIDADTTATDLAPILFHTFPLTERVKARVRDEGQPMFGLSGRDLETITAARAFSEQVKSGRSATVHADVINAGHDTLRPHLDLLEGLPEGHGVGFLETVHTPFPDVDPDFVVATFRMHDGGEVEYAGSWTSMRPRRAQYSPDQKAILFFRFAADLDRGGSVVADRIKLLDRDAEARGGGGDLLGSESGPHSQFAEGLIGEFLHELYHARRANGLIDDAVHLQLISHGQKLRLLDMDLGDYLQKIKRSDSGAAARKTNLKEAYERAYSTYPNKAEVVAEEYATHLLELAWHGAIKGEDLAPVRHLIERLFAGSDDRMARRLSALDNEQPRLALAGPKALTADLRRLELAQEMEARGRTGVEIYEATNWFRDNKGGWYYRIPDAEIELKPAAKETAKGKGRGRYTQPGPLKGVISAPEHFQAYPQLGKATTVLQHRRTKAPEGIMGVGQVSGDIDVVVGSAQAALARYVEAIQKVLDNIEGRLDAEPIALAEIRAARDSIDMEAKATIERLAALDDPRWQLAGDAAAPLDRAALTAHLIELRLLRESLDALDFLEAWRIADERSRMAIGGEDDAEVKPLSVVGVVEGAPEPGKPVMGGFPAAPHLGWAGLPEAPFRANLKHIAEKRKLKDGPKPLKDLSTPGKVQKHIELVLSRPTLAWLKTNRGQPESLNFVRVGKNYGEVVAISLSKSDSGALHIPTAYAIERKQLLFKLSSAIYHDGPDAIKWQKTPEAQREVLHLMEQVPAENRGPSWTEVKRRLGKSQRDDQVKMAIGGEDEPKSAWEEAQDPSWGGMSRRGTAGEISHAYAPEGKEAAKPSVTLREQMQRLAATDVRVAELMLKVRVYERELWDAGRTPVEIAGALAVRFPKFAHTFDPIAIAKREVWWMVDEIIERETGKKVLPTPEQERGLAEIYRSAPGLPRMLEQAGALLGRPIGSSTFYRLVRELAGRGLVEVRPVGRRGPGGLAGFRPEHERGVAAIYTRGGGVDRMLEQARALTGRPLTVGSFYDLIDRLAERGMVEKRPVNATRGPYVWTSERVAALTSDDVAALSIADAAALLNTRFPAAGFTAQAVKQARRKQVRLLQRDLSEADALGIPVDRMMEESLGDTAPVLAAAAKARAAILTAWRGMSDLRERAKRSKEGNLRLAQIEADLEKYGIKDAKTEAEAERLLTAYLRAPDQEATAGRAGDHRPGDERAGGVAGAAGRDPDVQGGPLEPKMALGGDPVTVEMEAATRAADIAETLKVCKS